MQCSNCMLSCLSFSSVMPNLVLMLVISRQCRANEPRPYLKWSRSHLMHLTYQDDVSRKRTMPLSQSAPYIRLCNFGCLHNIGMFITLITQGAVKMHAFAPCHSEHLSLYYDSFIDIVSIMTCVAPDLTKLNNYQFFFIFCSFNDLCSSVRIFTLFKFTCAP